jgi:hypothetical protein
MPTAAHDTSPGRHGRCRGMPALAQVTSGVRECRPGCDRTRHTMAARFRTCDAGPWAWRGEGDRPSGALTGDSAGGGHIVTAPLAGSPHLDGHHDPRAVPQLTDHIADAFQPAVRGVQPLMPKGHVQLIEHARGSTHPVPCRYAASRARDDAHGGILADAFDLPASARAYPDTSLSCSAHPIGVATGVPVFREVSRCRYCWLVHWCRGSSCMRYTCRR